MLVSPFVALSVTPLSDYTAEKLVEMWEADDKSPAETDYTLLEAQVGQYCRDHGKTASDYLRMPDSLPEIEAFGTDMRYNAAASWLKREQDKAANIISESNAGNKPGQASSPKTRRMARGGADEYMKHKMERAQHGR
jgi:hypothetical protein